MREEAWNAMTLSASPSGQGRRRAPVLGVLTAGAVALLVGGCTVVESGGGPYAAEPSGYVYSGGGGYAVPTAPAWGGGYAVAPRYRGVPDYAAAAAAGDSYCREALASVRQAEAQAAYTGDYGQVQRARGFASRDC